MIKSKLLSPAKEGGFTIIEALLAIVVIGIFLSSLGPVIALSVATRVQAKRIESGTQAARGYLDGVRSGAIPAPPISNANGNFFNVAVPNSGGFTCNTANDYCSSNAQLYCIDGDGDGQCTSQNAQDFIIQAFGYNIDNATSNSDRAKSGYALGIRVYRGDGFGTNGTLKKTENNATESAKASNITGGLGDRYAPLVEITTDISSSSTTYKDFCTRIDPNNNNKECLN